MQLLSTWVRRFFDSFKFFRHDFVYLIVVAELTLLERVVDASLRFRPVLRFLYSLKIFSRHLNLSIIRKNTIGGKFSKFRKLILFQAKFIP
jgi:hypothetical protein